MVAEWIIEELAKTKDNLEEKMRAQIAMQQAKAKTEYIVPKNATLDKERDESLLKEKQDYDAKLAELQKTYNERIKVINDTCELQREAYANQVYATIEAEVGKQFKDTLKVLDQQINAK